MLQNRKNYHSKKPSEIWEYWKNPNDGKNSPLNYLKHKKRSQFLVKLIKKYAKPNSNILEIGCNAGRNINYLYCSNFRKLSGIEINKKAVQLLRTSYPTMAKLAKIYNSPVEEIIKKFTNRQFDIVFTMAVLEHIHENSEWIFYEMTRITNSFIITIEDEKCISWRHFPRNYKKIFEKLRMKQVEAINCIKEEHGLHSNFVARIFKK